MSSPRFSKNPADYDAVKGIFALNSVTPVILVIGGSYATNTVGIKSDLDLWGVFSEERPEITISADERMLLVGNSEWTQVILLSMSEIKAVMLDPFKNNDPPRRIWFYENFMAYPRIFDTPEAESYRKALGLYDNPIVALWYLETGDWFMANMDQNEKMTTRETRLFLTGVRLLEVGDLIVNHQTLLDWAGISTLAEARNLLVTTISNI